MKRLIILIIFIVAGYYHGFAECYLEIDNPGGYQAAAVTQIALAHISQFFEPVNEIPPAGISDSDCVYRLSINEVSNGILVTIKGKDLAAYGDSRLRGLDGFKQALYRAIINVKPETKPVICKRYSAVMGSDCGDHTPVLIQRRSQEGTLVVRVPRRHRFSVILQNGRPIGEMSGETVKEFKLPSGEIMSLKAEDGKFESEIRELTLMPDELTRIEFKQFSKRRTEENPTRQPQSGIEESPAVDFGDDNPFILGFGFGPYQFSSDRDEYRNQRGGINSLVVMDMFMDYFFTKNLGIGMKIRMANTEEKLNSGEDTDRLTIGMFFATMTMWFPLSTKNKGYSHFGLTGGAGLVSYNREITGDNYSGDEYKWEANGTGSMIGAFFDWGGDTFGGRIAYQIMRTASEKLKNKMYPESSSQYDVDASGAGWTLNLRWAF